MCPVCNILHSVQLATDISYFLGIFIVETLKCIVSKNFKVEELFISQEMNTLHSIGGGNN